MCLYMYISTHAWSLLLLHMVYICVHTPSSPLTCASTYSLTAHIHIANIHSEPLVLIAPLPHAIHIFFINTLAKTCIANTLYIYVRTHSLKHVYFSLLTVSILPPLLCAHSTHICSIMVSFPTALTALLPHPHPFMKACKGSTPSIRSWLRSTPAICRSLDVFSMVWLSTV